MLISVVIPLVAGNACPDFPTASGRLVHGFWHHHWQVLDAATADQVHPNNDLAGFTLSPLLGLPEAEPGCRTVPISVGQPAWFRIATLDPAITQALIRQPDGWLVSLPRQIPIGKVTWLLQSRVSDEAAPWNQLVRYADLAGSARPHWKWTLRLESPASFSGAFADFTVPLPELLVASWLKRWNRFAPGDQPPLTEQLVELARTNLRLVEYDLHTLPGERETIGCVGQVTIQAFDLPPERRVQLDLLFHYATFCGSGHRTAQGMGLTRLLEAG